MICAFLRGGVRDACESVETAACLVTSWILDFGGGGKEGFLAWGFVCCAVLCCASCCEVKVLHNIYRDVEISRYS